jgi:hypothetical protein
MQRKFVSLTAKEHDQVGLETTCSHGFRCCKCISVYLLASGHEERISQRSKVPFSLEQMQLMISSQKKMQLMIGNSREYSIRLLFRDIYYMQNVKGDTPDFACKWKCVEVRFQLMNIR